MGLGSRIKSWLGGKDWRALGEKAAGAVRYYGEKIGEFAVHKAAPLAMMLGFPELGATIASAGAVAEGIATTAGAVEKALGATGPIGSYAQARRGIDRANEGIQNIRSLRSMQRGSPLERG